MTVATQLVERIQQICGGSKPDLVASEKLLLSLYQQLNQTQRNQMAMERLLSDLQKELEKQDRFTQQAARYQLAQTDLGGRVYELKKSDDDSGEPQHEICATCYDEAQRSILQPSAERYDTLVCPRCQALVPKTYGQSRSGPNMPPLVPDY